MHVVSRPIEEAVALYEEPREGCTERLRVLIFRDGLLPPQVLRLLSKLLDHV